MVGTRYFNTGRDAGRVGVASQIMRIEIVKKGKLPAADRYKQILKNKMEANKKKVLGDRVKVGFNLPTSFGEARKMSKQAEQKLKEVAQRKAIKEAKKLQQMVLVTPRTYSNGILDKKGRIYDVAGNLVAQVNTKNGRMSTMMGWSLGRYKPKSFMTDITIQNAITQHSPYFVNLRKQQMLQQQGVQSFGVHGMMGLPDEVINVQGTATPVQSSAFYGSDMGPARQNVGVTSWGARSDNVWGNFADNAWGGFADNAWGGNSTDVWGGISAPGMWGQKGPLIWGTGSGKNILRAIMGTVGGLFGLSTKQGRMRLNTLTKASGGPGRMIRTAASTRSTGAAPSAPTGGKR